MGVEYLVMKETEVVGVLTKVRPRKEVTSRRRALLRSRRIFREE
jgi:hypothetical protein